MPRPDKFILDEAGNPVPCDDTQKWGKWFETAGELRRVGLDKIGNPPVKVSTVFLGLDHNFDGGPPLLYETMIFGGKHDDAQFRYSTKEEAIAGHAKAVALVKGEYYEEP